jgi:FkbM family methyltransferase
MDFTLKSVINDLLEYFTGRRLTKHIDFLGTTRDDVLLRCAVDTIIDVGANKGQWAKPLVKKFPSANFYSFEPLPNIFEYLELTARDHRNWNVHNQGVGAKRGVARINVASNSGLSSSFLESTNHSVVHPNIIFEKSNLVIDIIPLDDFMGYGARNFLKIDTGGFENSVLDGISSKMNLISAIEIESSFTPMYEGESSHHRVISRLEDSGFVPISFGNVHRDLSGRVWQLDTLLIKRDLIG